MVVCKFWQQGACRFGDKCRFEHPPDPSRNVPNGNRFAALQSNDNPRNNSNNNGANRYQGGPSSASQALPYSLDKAAIITDLSSERPQWILSAYGPGRHAPAQLFGGTAREQSFEELRLAQYELQASGNAQQAIEEANKLFQASEQQIQTALHDVDGAIRFIIQAENQHPNRIDIVKESMGQNPGSGSQPNPFGGASLAQPASTSNPFGAPSQPGIASNPFGTPAQRAPNVFGTQSTTIPAATLGGSLNQPLTATAFGAPSQAGAFGQPSALGQRSNPFGAQSAPAFGASTQLGSGGAFGQPSALGQTAHPFGASSGGSVPSTSQPAPFSTFSATSNLFGSQPGTTTSAPFGATSQPAVSNLFGAPFEATKHGQISQPQNSTPFGAPSPAPKNTFGTPPQSAPTNPFNNAQPAGAFGQNPISSNSFGGASSGPAPQNLFGILPQPAAHNPFGGQPTPQANPIGAPAAASAPNPFGRPLSNPPLNSNPFGQPPAMGVNGTSSNGSSIPLCVGHPPINSYSSKDGNGRLTMFNGKRVEYRDNVPETVELNGGRKKKIWFSSGAPALNGDGQMEDSAYDENTTREYATMRQTGRFERGKMPLLPPKKEWCRWDF